jgi:hypothetical protein
MSVSHVSAVMNKVGFSFGRKNQLSSCMFIVFFLLFGPFTNTSRAKLECSSCRNQHSYLRSVQG